MERLHGAGIPDVVARVYGIGVAKMRRYGARRLRRIIGISAGAAYTVFNNNLRNLVDAVTKRVYLVRSEEGYARPPRPLSGAVRRLDWIRTRLVRDTPCPPVVPVGSYAALYTGSQKARYERAEANLFRGFRPTPNRTFRSFIKTEAAIGKVGKPLVPRVITAACPEYNVLTGRYLKNLEPLLAKAIGRVAGYPVICKGYNAEQVARKLRNDWDSFRCPVAVGLDASRFDQHVSDDLLRWEFSIYDGIFHSDELRRLLEYQISPKVLGLAADGQFRYTGSGRCSGVINTGMGNCLIMSSLVLTYAKHRGIRIRLANNGDDCVCTMEAEDLERFTSDIGTWFHEMGFTLEVETPVHTFECIEFCQTQPVWAGRWIMCRNPYVHADKDTCSLVGWSTPADVAAWRCMVAEGGRCLNAGVPFWFDWYSRLGAGSGDTRRNRDMVLGRGRWRFALHNLKPRSHHVTARSRHSFWLAFGMLPDAQVELEKLEFNMLDAGPMVKSGWLNHPPLHLLLSLATRIRVNKSTHQHG